MIDADTLKRVARTKGIRNLGYSEKDYFQEVILLGVSREAPSLVFKGGTAVYKMYGLDRFSEDLDFSGEVERRTVERIASYISDFGYEAKVSVKTVGESVLATFAAEGFLYRGTPESLARVRMDVSTRGDVLLEPTWETLFSLYPDLPSFRLRVMARAEMLAEKLRALLVRRKARDAYDAWFLLGSGVRVDDKLLARKLELYDLAPDSALLDDALDECGRNWSAELGAMTAHPPEFGVVREAIVEGARLKKGKI